MLAHGSASSTTAEPPPQSKNVLLDIPDKWPDHTHAAFIVDSIDQLVCWLNELGIEITEGPSTFGHGRRKVCFIRDPDGNVIEFDEILGAHSG
jgi:catechol 2,3-dioxygenase-like lactoylglutathione lyase family enzyme